MKNTLLIIGAVVIVVILAIAGYYWPTPVDNNNQNGNGQDKSDLIIVDEPQSNDVISSPLQISGEARGNWYFEASFPVMLVDQSGRTIAQGIATAQDEWMTTEFVPFEAELEFQLPEDVTATSTGKLVLQKDNPSGLPENDDSLEIPVKFDLTAK